MKRRNFIRNITLSIPALSLPTVGLKAGIELPAKGSPELLLDEHYWERIRLAFEVPEDFIQLENGYFSPQPKYTFQHHEIHARNINQRTSWFMRREQEQALEESRSALADFLNTNPEQLAMVRNTTEAMNTIIMGKNWEKGDEVILGDLDYGSMRAAFEQIAKRHGVRLKIAQVPLFPNSDQEVIDAYLQHAGPKTRLIHLTHLINLSGQIIPVAAVAREAKSRGIETAVDAAHSIAHINFGIESLEADYVGASLHKWLSAPLGSGMLWVRKEKIASLWPLMADDTYPEDNIRKLEHCGTRPVQTLMALHDAIAFHHQIGIGLKEARLRYLKDLWHQELFDHPGLVQFTPLGERSCAIANVCVRGMKPSELAQKLLSTYQIFTVAINHPVIQGVRITPHVFTRPTEVEKLKEALTQIIH